MTYVELWILRRVMVDGDRKLLPLATRILDEAIEDRKAYLMGRD